MNYYRTLNKPGGYKKPHRKNEELVLEITQHGGGKAKGQKHKSNKNGESHCFQCESEYYWVNFVTELRKEQQGKVHSQFEDEEL